MITASNPIQSIKTILGSTSDQFVIPKYQRNFSWGRTQCEKLCDDILLYYRTGGVSKNGDYFLGNLMRTTVSIAPGHNRFDIIDGQQRLTACSIFILAIKNFGGAKLSKIDDCLFTSSYLSFNRIELKTNDEVEFNALLSTGACNDSKIKVAYDVFTLFISEWVTKYSYSLNDLWYCFDTIKLVDIQIAGLVAGVMENSQEIFEKLNARGLPLRDEDKIRNYMMMKEPSQNDKNNQERLFWAPLDKLFIASGVKDYENSIDRFFLQYLESKIKSWVSSVELYEEFKKWLDSELKSKSISDIYNDMLKMAKFFVCFIDPQKWSNAAKQNLFEGGLACGQTTHIPFFLHLKTLGSSDTDIENCLQHFVSYFVRRVFCKAKSSGLTKKFIEMITKISSLTNISSQVENYLKALSGNNYYPSNGNFNLHMWKSFNLYGEGYAFAAYVLKELNNANSISTRMLTTPVVKLQIEHILPQTISAKKGVYWQAALGANWATIHKDVVHLVGNLTLTDVNQKLGNIQFAGSVDKDKQSMLDRTTGICIGYNSSSITDYLNKDIKSISASKWDDTEIDKRADRLWSGAAINGGVQSIWKY